MAYAQLYNKPVENIPVLPASDWCPFSGADHAGPAVLRLGGEDGRGPDGGFGRAAQVRQAPEGESAGAGRGQKCGHGEEGDQVAQQGHRRGAHRGGYGERMNKYLANKQFTSVDMRNRSLFLLNIGICNSGKSSPIGLL
eukprot:2642801-Pyramimonas_sp.AAC.1